MVGMKLCGDVARRIMLDRGGRRGAAFVCEVLVDLCLS